MGKKGNEEVSPSRKKRCVQARDQRDAASRPTNKQGADRVTGMWTNSQQRTRGTRRGGLEECEMQTTGARGGISGQVREAGAECVSWRRRREHQSSSSSERSEASEQQASSSSSEREREREREEQREDFPAKITSCPDLSSRKVNIACGTIMPFDLVSSSRYAFNHAGGSR